MILMITKKKYFSEMPIGPLVKERLGEPYRAQTGAARLSNCMQNQTGTRIADQEFQDLALRENMKATKSSLQSESVQPSSGVLKSADTYLPPRSCFAF